MFWGCEIKLLHFFHYQNLIITWNYFFVCVSWIIEDENLWKENANDLLFLHCTTLVTRLHIKYTSLKFHYCFMILLNFMILQFCVIVIMFFNTCKRILLLLWGLCDVSFELNFNFSLKFNLFHFTLKEVKRKTQHNQSCCKSFSFSVFSHQNKQNNFFL